MAPTLVTGYRMTTAIELDNDFRSRGAKGKDGYELFLRQLLDNGLSIPTAGLARIRVEPF